MAQRRIGQARWTFAKLEALGRERLSRYFFMREFLYSEIANLHAIPNLPDDPALALAAGRRLAQDLLDPLVETFGPIAVRSAYRAPAVNGFGNAHNLKCSTNAHSRANHIWDQRDERGRMGACASVVIPWFADQYAQGRDWRDLAWWIHDHLPYSAIWFFPIRAAFNLTWREAPQRTISSYIAPRGRLLREGAEPAEPPDVRRARYADFPSFRGIRYPDPPTRP